MPLSPPDPGIGQVAMFSEVTQAADGTAPGTGAAGPAGLAETPPGRPAAACRCSDKTDAPASASTPPATTYRGQRGRTRSAPAVPMTSGSGLPSGPNGNTPHHLPEL
jgi:hypothetical protein